MANNVTSVEPKTKDLFNDREAKWLSITGTVNIIGIVLMAIFDVVMDKTHYIGPQTKMLIAGYILMTCICSITSANGMRKTKQDHPDYDCIGFKPLFILRSGTLLWPLALITVLSMCAYVMMFCRE